MRRAAGRAGEDGGVLLMKERALLASEQRETAHLRNMVTRGEYVKLDSMQRLVEHDYAVVRERILTVPGKAADSLQPYTAKDRQAIMEILTSEAHEALADLSSDEFWFRKKMTRVKAMRGKPKAVADVDDAKELAT
jgi:phage terminase Nu1 subunit (DNA packaging protein)